MQFPRTAGPSVQCRLPRRPDDLVEDVFPPLRMGLRHRLRQLRVAASELVYAGAECPPVQRLRGKGSFRGGRLRRPRGGDGRVAVVGSGATALEPATG